MARRKDPTRTRPGEMLAKGTPDRWVGPEPIGTAGAGPNLNPDAFDTSASLESFPRQEGFQGPFPAQPVGTYPNLGANPYINPNVPPASYPGSFAPTDLLMRLQGYLRGWFIATNTLREKMKRDYEYAEGNGKQWLNNDVERVRATGRPVLEFNQILPQVELVCGIHRNTQIDFKCQPRNHRDARLAEIGTAALYAARDFTRLQRVSDKVFDDATITGLGVWELVHSIEDAEDLIWGDIVASRINPMAFVWDPWSAGYDLQDGAFMGKASWMNIDAFRDRYPDFKYTSIPGEWLAGHGLYGGDSTDLGTPPNLLAELYDQQAGRIRMLTLWYKVPSTVAFVVNTETGQVQEVPDPASGEAMLSDIAARHGRDATAQMSVMASDTESAVVHRATGMPLPHPSTGAPMVYATPEAAQAALDDIGKQAGMGVYEKNRVVTRKVLIPHFTEMTWWTIMRSGRTPFVDRKFPFVAYISRRFTDDPESIMGIVRNLEDPQDEYNKRYSNMLAHVNSSTHSGWLNRKSGGANTSELEKMGSKPGVVVEYGAVKPEQIKPVELSAAHAAMLELGASNIMKISGVNAEMLGDTTQKTVSGRAIAARQSGGNLLLKPRFRTYEEAELDVAQMLLRRVQQFYPPEKLKRIIEIEEMNKPMGQMGASLFQDPATGMPVPDEIILQQLGSFRNFQYDLVLAMQPSSPTERQAQFEQIVQVMGLITSMGLQIGPSTVLEIMKLMDIPPKVERALLQDMQQAMQQAQLKSQMQMAAGIPPGTPTQANIGDKGAGPSKGSGNPQHDAILRLLSEVRGGRAGGNEGNVGGANV